MVELRDISRMKSIVKTLKLRKTNFQLFKELVGGSLGKLLSGIKELAAL